MKESQIRPQGLFNEFLESARRDVRRFFPEDRSRIPISCPACRSDRPVPAFEKFGMAYALCEECGSLFVSPRPPREQFDRYAREGEAVKFWSDRFYRETARERREQIYQPRAELVRRLAGRYRSGVELFVDIGCGFGIFLDEVARLKLFGSTIGVEPAPNMAAATRERGFFVVEKPVEALDPGELQADFATSFEVLEHVYAPHEFVSGIARALCPGGVLLLTTLTISGFDLQVLWDRSKSIHPPHHINLLSTEGIRRLVEACGFEVLDVNTPGQLDVDIVRNAVAEDPTIPLPRFVAYLLTKRNQQAQADFQQYLQRHGLSSHVHCVARRRSAGAARGDERR